MIATMAFGKAVPWAAMMIQSLKRVCDLPVIFFAMQPGIRKLGEDERVDMDMDKLWNSLHDRVNRGVDDKAKSLMFGIAAERFGCTELLHVDADCLVLDRIDTAWQGTGDIALAEETLGPYQKYLQVFDAASNRTFNAGVILFRRDFSAEWSLWYEKLWPFVADDPLHVDGQTVWNLVWHTWPKADILGQRFNQLHIKHGPYGAAIYHFSAVDISYKAKVMASCFKYHLGEWPRHP